MMLYKLLFINIKKMILALTIILFLLKTTIYQYIKKNKPLNSLK